MALPRVPTPPEAAARFDRRDRAGVRLPLRAGIDAAHSGARPPRRTRAALLALALLLGAPAVAEEPENPRVWLEEGTVFAELRVPRAPAEVAQTVGDPWAIARIDGQGLEIERVEDAACDLLEYRLKSVIGPIRYRVRYCAEGRTWTATLEGEGDMREYLAVWSVEPAGEGSLVRYRIHSRPNLRVPDAFVDRSTKKAVTRLMPRLEAALLAPTP